MNSEDDENEDPIDEEEEKEEDKRTEKAEIQSGNKYRRSTK
jgi:hypothetical protein